LSFLDKLKQNKETILLAEIGALFHDIGKANEKFIEKHAKNTNNISFNHHLIQSFTPPIIYDYFKNHNLTFCGESVSFIDIIEKHHNRQPNGSNLTNQDIPNIIKLLYAGWNGYDGIDSGSDKGQLENKSIVGQNKDKTSIATAFGFESELHQLTYFEDKKNKIFDLIIKIIRESEDIVSFREKIFDILYDYYSLLLGETRRPSNDVTLWDHSYSVASMFKCVVAKKILDCSNPSSYNALEFKWNFLSLNIDILSILSKGIKLGDIIRYQDTIEGNFDKCKNFIEIEYPIGNEIYRDSTGIYFLVVELNKSQYKTLKIDLIQNIDPELMTSIHYESSNLPNSNISEQEQEDEHKKEFRNVFKQIQFEAREELKYPTSFSRFIPEAYNQDWNDKEICPVCQIRPKSQKKKICKVCDKNRIKTAKKWLNEEDRHKGTIWIDEISDKNNQVAAIIGKFNLNKWLDGKYIETLVVNKSKINDTNDTYKKSPSPSRIRRCWETTLNFIKDTVISKILNEFFSQEEKSSDLNFRTRRIAFKILPKINLNIGATVDIEIDGKIISPVYIDNNEGRFLTTHNLNLTPNWGKNESEILDFLNDNSRIVKVKSKDGKSWRNQDFSIKTIKVPDSKFVTYFPHLSIFTFPDQFMVLVPADQALDILSKIIEEYEIQFGKVRDRLPLHLGIIGFHRKTPLNLVMESAANWLDRIKEIEKKKGTLEAEVCGKEICNDNITPTECNLTLKCGDYCSEKFSWKIPLRMGDPDVKDLWYPYIRVKGSMPSDRDLCFGFNNKSYCCHIKNIECSDIILFDPCYFSLEYLDKASKRWRIGEKFHSLNDFIRLQSLWDAISKKMRNGIWSISHLHAYWKETTNIRDFTNDFDVKKHYIKACMKNILKLSKNQNTNSTFFNTILETTLNGLFDLCLFWNLQIKKSKPSKITDKFNKNKVM